MKFIGAHVSAAGGVSKAPLNAKEIGATAFALFVKNQRQWLSAPLDPVEIEKFKKNCHENNFTPDQILPHDGYLINLGNPDNEKRNKSLKSFLDEARRCESLGLKYLNFHPGSHLKQIDEKHCLKLIAENLKTAIKDTENITFVVENTAGQGTNLGYRFEQLAELIEQTGMESRMGVCLDSCHTFTSGYDIKDQYERVFEEFDNTVGFKYLKAMHINDSKKELGSRVDRHESLGKGFIGIDFFKKLMKDSRMENIPLIMETPDSSIWKEEIQQLTLFSKSE